MLPLHHGGAERSVDGIDVLTQQPLHLHTPATHRIFFRWGGYIKGLPGNARMIVHSTLQRLHLARPLASFQTHRRDHRPRSELGQPSKLRVTVSDSNGYVTPVHRIILLGKQAKAACLGC
ncbi:hypothetical protein SCLCIDRAFT_802001 [Scleroderma citrinum Foug A]|uniref:Uncharacterized protein n=1 Tax=Scleroderma citrinum Foug A TaxID=1036808 RepID=A0A0C3E1U2_9AGAM|nr:hypothetical protein SCLCIDRAFT_802001 [Scleroderma citrinum Foug A]